MKCYGLELDAGHDLIIVWDIEYSVSPQYQNRWKLHQVEKY